MKKNFFTKTFVRLFTAVILLSLALSSCIDSGYDLDNLDDSGGFTPALVLPIGTLSTGIMDLITEAGIPKDLLEVSDSEISIVYSDRTSLKLISPIPGLDDGITLHVPSGTEIKFAFANGEEVFYIDVFEYLASNGSALYPSNPQIRLGITNYIGADINLDINGITSYGSNGRTSSATFDNGGASYTIPVEGAANPGEYKFQSETFDKDNGRLHELFSIAPDSLSYNFSVDLTVPDDGKQHFIVSGQYVDLDYEIRLPLTFNAGTQLSGADTISLDLSGDDFVSDLGELALWIDYENGIPATLSLDILFLDENRQTVSGIADRNFRIDASQATGASTGTLKFEFSASEFEVAKKVRDVVLKTTLKVESGEVSIRPSDYIKLKLSAYSKVNLNI